MKRSFSQRAVRLASTGAASLSAATSVSLPPSVLAQNPAAAALRGAEVLPRVTVTGYAGEVPQPAGVTYSVLPAQAFGAGGLNDTRSLTAVTPNTSSFDGNNPRTPRFSVRGFRDNNFLSGEPVTALYVDDVPYLDLASRGLPLFDVERMELVRGPQGTWSGASGPAGVLNITSRKPENYWNADGRFGYGNHDHFTLQAAGGGAVVKDRLGFRLSGLWDFRDGFVHNQTLDTHPDDRDSLAGRAELSWTPSAEWEISAAVDAARFRDGFVPTFYPGADSDSFDVCRNFDGYVDTDQFGQSLRIRRTGASARLTSITAHRDWKQDLLQDFDFTALDLLNGFSRPELDQWSQEFRLESLDTTARLRWTGGFFFAARDQNSESGSTEGSQAPPRVIESPGSPPLEVRQTTLLTAAQADATTYALFGQVTYELSDMLNLIGGLRWTLDERRLNRTGSLSSPNASVGGLPAGPVSFPTAAYSLDGDFTDVQPKLGVTADLSNTTQAYFSFSTGYQSGGFNASSDTPSGAVFGPARSKHYEFGLKSASRDGKLAGNLALFLIETDNYQVHRLSTQNPTQASVQNAEEARARGAEVEVFYRPAAGWELNAGVGYVQAEFETYLDPVNDVVLDGNRISFVPEFTATAGIQYRFPFGLYARVDAQGIGEYSLTEDNSSMQPAYALVNARIGYEWRNWGLHVFGRNLLDERYASNALDLRSAAAPDLLIFQPGDPLTFGVAVSASF